MNRLDSDCIVTFDQTKSELEDIERRLASQLNLDPNAGIRQQLIGLSMRGELDDCNEIVKRWHQTYASFVDSIANPK